MAAAAAVSLYLQLGLKWDSDRPRLRLHHDRDGDADDDRVARHDVADTAGAGPTLGPSTGRCGRMASAGQRQRSG